MDLRVADLGRIGGEAQPPRRHVARQQRGEVRLVERGLALRQQRHLGLVDVQAHHVVAELRHAGRVHGAEVAASDHRDSHGPRLSRGPPAPAGSTTSRCRRARGALSGPRRGGTAPGRERWGHGYNNGGLHRGKRDRARHHRRWQHVARHRARLDPHQGSPHRPGPPAAGHRRPRVEVQARGRGVDLRHRRRLVRPAGRLRGPRRRRRGHLRGGAGDGGGHGLLGDDARLHGVRRGRRAAGAVPHLAEHHHRRGRAWS